MRSYYTVESSTMISFVSQFSTDTEHCTTGMIGTDGTVGAGDGDISAMISMRNSIKAEGPARSLAY